MHPLYSNASWKVLAGLKTKEGRDFTSVYIDDVVVFSEIMEGHLQHLRKVLMRLGEFSLKLKPHFLRESVEYLGHLITAEGLKSNPKQVEVVRFPKPSSVTGVQQFLGLTSYYRRFIDRFAKVAAQLHALTQKDVSFNWTGDCEQAFEMLKKKVTESPILSHPDFSLDFVLETDACGQGLVLCYHRGENDHPRYIQLLLLVVRWLLGRETTV